MSDQELINKPPQIESAEAAEDPTQREVDDEIDVVDQEEAEETEQIKAELRERQRSGD
jgi:hypothetical protein